MKLKLFIVVIVVGLLQSCGTGIGSSREKKPPLWEFIPSTSALTPKFPTASFRLNSKAYIDSFTHFEAKTHGKVPEVKLLMPLPNIDGQTDDYYFSPIYDAGPNKDTMTLGFIGTNASNKKDLSSLYIRNGRVIVKWMSPDKNWMLQSSRSEDTPDIYTLVDLDGGPPELRKAPLPTDTY